jgi:hypothetical protein
MKPAFLIFAAWLGAPAHAVTDDPVIPAPSVESFARALQDAVAKRDVARVASMVKYPLAVTSEGRRRRVGQTQFAAEFDRIFSDSVTQEVLAQDPTQLFQNDQGVMFGNGVVWASEFCNGQKRPNCSILIITVNRPTK